MNKRGFLKVVIATGAFIVSGIVAIPTILTAFSPVRKRQRGERWVAVGELSSFPAGETRAANVEIPRADSPRFLPKKGVYVWRASPDEIVVFSRNCTDLSCPVTWDAGSGVFFCPCHGGIFARNGDRMAGPPKRPLYRYANRVRKGRLEIDLNSVPPMV